MQIIKWQWVELLAIKMTKIEKADNNKFMDMENWNSPMLLVGP